MTVYASPDCDPFAFCLRRAARGAVYLAIDSIAIQSCLKTLIIQIGFAQRISADLLINRMQFLTQKFR